MPKIKGTLENPGLPVATEITPETVFVGSIDDSPEGTKQYPFALMNQFIADAAASALVIKSVAPLQLYAAGTAIGGIIMEESINTKSISCPNAIDVLGKIYLYYNDILELLDLSSVKRLLGENNSTNYIQYNPALVNLLLDSLEQIGTPENNVGLIIQVLPLTVLNLSKLKTINGWIFLDRIHAIIDLPNLKDAGGLSIDQNNVQTVIDLSSVIKGSSISFTNLSLLTNIIISNNIEGLDNLNIQGNQSLTNINISTITEPLTYCTVKNCSSLTEIIINNSNQSTYIDFSGNALTQANIEDIINKVEAAGTSTGQLALQGGTNFRLSTASRAKRELLFARGWGVTDNDFPLTINIRNDFPYNNSYTLLHTQTLFEKLTDISSSYNHNTPIKQIGMWYNSATGLFEQNKFNAVKFNYPFLEVIKYNIEGVVLSTIVYNGLQTFLFTDYPHGGLFRIYQG